MAEKSKYYYTGTVRGDEYIQGIFMFAFTPNDRISKWDSNTCNSSVNFQTLVKTARSNERVTVAMLHSQAVDMFPKNKSFDLLAIYGFDSGKGNYMYGPTITSLFYDVTVINVQGIPQGKGLPSYYGPQEQVMIQKKLRIISFSAVTFEIKGDTEVKS